MFARYDEELFTLFSFKDNWFVIKKQKQFSTQYFILPAISNALLLIDWIESITATQEYFPSLTVKGAGAIV